jgi:hypothetical protein
MPALSVNTANEARKGVAATEAFRNEMVKQGAQAQQVLYVTAQQTLLKEAREHAYNNCAG